MDRREFLKTAAAGVGAVALPGAALAKTGQVVGIDPASRPDQAVYTIYRAVGIVSGWTKSFGKVGDNGGWANRDHYTAEAVAKALLDEVGG